MSSRPLYRPGAAFAEGLGSSGGRPADRIFRFSLGPQAPSSSRPDAPSAGSRPARLSAFFRPPSGLLDARGGTFPAVEGDSLMPLLIALAAGVLLFLVDAYRTKPGDPL